LKGIADCEYGSISNRKKLNEILVWKKNLEQQNASESNPILAETRADDFIRTHKLHKDMVLPTFSINIHKIPDFVNSTPPHPESDTARLQSRKPSGSLDDRVALELDHGLQNLEASR
jgi:hypothetical protein